MTVACQEAFQRQSRRGRWSTPSPVKTSQDFIGCTSAAVRRSSPSPEAEVATGPCIRLSPSAAMSRCADRSLFAETFHAFCGTIPGLTAAGFIKLCKHCFLLDEHFTVADADAIFWQVIECDPLEASFGMGLAQFEEALTLIARKKHLAADALRRAVALAGSCTASHVPSVDSGPQTIRAHGYAEQQHADSGCKVLHNFLGDFLQAQPAQIPSFEANHDVIARPRPDTACCFGWPFCTLPEAVDDPPDGAPPATAPNTTTTQTTTIPVFCATVEGGRTCHLREETNDWPGNEVAWDGDLVFPEGKDIQWTRPYLEFKVTGDIILRYAARLISESGGVKMWTGGNSGAQVNSQRLLTKT
eukprot:s1351_g4.t1